MRNISKILVAFLCLTILSCVTTATPTYAAELDLKFDNHDIGAANSWYQPVIIRNVPNRNYAWTCIGDVYYNDGKSLHYTGIVEHFYGICQHIYVQYTKGRILVVLKLD